MSLPPPPDPGHLLRRREREDAGRLLAWWRDLWRGLGELRRAMLDAIGRLLLPSERLRHPATMTYLDVLHEGVHQFGWQLAALVKDAQGWALSQAAVALNSWAAMQAITQGFLADGTPLSLLGKRYAAEAVAASRKALMLPTVGHRALQHAVEPIKDRALLTARNEVYRAYRAGTLSIYRDNGEQGWYWRAALGPRCCAVCVGLHGTFHSIDEPFASHASCRCRPVLRAPSVSGVDWFAMQSPETQLAILGRGKLALYWSGRVTLADLIAETDSPRWGPGRAERPLSDFV